MTEKPPPPGPSMRAFAENWPVVREIIAGTGQSCAETTAAAKQSLAALRAAANGDRTDRVP